MVEPNRIKPTSVVDDPFVNQSEDILLELDDAVVAVFLNLFDNVFPSLAVRSTSESFLLFCVQDELLLENHDLQQSEKILPITKIYEIRAKRRSLLTSAAAWNSRYRMMYLSISDISAVENKWNILNLQTKNKKN